MAVVLTDYRQEMNRYSFLMVQWDKIRCEALLFVFNIDCPKIYPPGFKHFSVDILLWSRICIYRQVSLDLLSVIENIDRVENKRKLRCCNALVANYPVAVRVPNVPGCVL